jgi:hypothetical protein
MHQSVDDEVVTAARNKARAHFAGGSNDPARFEWPVLLRKLDRIDKSYKQ